METEPQETVATETEATTNDGIDWKAKAREWEKRAKDNKSAADELASLKDSQKSSEQKFEERLSGMEKRAQEAEARALRSDIATKHGISAEDRDLFLTGSDEAALEAQAKRLAERVADQKKNGNRAPKEGGTTSGDGKDKDMREFTRNLFASAQTD